jgi:predicted lipid carrier protein YhbT
MPLQYESSEFSEELRKRTNANVAYREKAKGMNWKTLIAVTDIPFAVFTSYSEGELVERKHVSAKEIEDARKNADFIVEIPTYELSIEVATGKKSMESLFLSRAIKVDGNIFKALQYRSAVEVYGKITADLANESTIPSKEDFVKTLHERGLL